MINRSKNIQQYHTNMNRAGLKERQEHAFDIDENLKDDQLVV